MFKTKQMPARLNGSVLFIVLIICLMCSIIGIGILSLSFNSRMLGVRSSADITARLAADAAVAQAIYQMNEKLKIKPWDDTSLPAVTNNALLSSDATYDYAVSKGVDGVYTVRGTGKAIRGTRTVNCTLRLYSPFDLAVYTRNTLELKNSTVVNWYNNQPDDWPLQVGTNSTADGAIQLMSNTTVNGDLVVGAGGNTETVIDSHASVTVTGDTYPMISNPVLPTITVPAWLAAMASGGDINGPTTLIASGKYDRINLKNSETITVTEPVVLYIIGNIDLGNDANINIGGPNDIDNNASLTIYLAGNLEGKYSAGFNNFTTDSKRLYIYGLDTCTSFTLKNDDDFCGALYAPNASVDLDNAANVYGSIVSKNFVLRNSANVYYDAALRDRTVNDEAVRFAIQRWSEQ